MTRRQRDLLRKAAESLENGGDPFATHFLATHNVTLDEAMALADHVAEAIRFRYGPDRQEAA